MRPVGGSLYKRPAVLGPTPVRRLLKAPRAARWSLRVKTGLILACGLLSTPHSRLYERATRHKISCFCFPVSLFEKGGSFAFRKEKLRPTNWVWCLQTWAANRGPLVGRRASQHVRDLCAKSKSVKKTLLKNPRSFWEKKNLSFGRPKSFPGKCRKSPEMRCVLGRKFAFPWVPFWSQEFRDFPLNKLLPASFLGEGLVLRGAPKNLVWPNKTFFLGNFP